MPRFRLTSSMVLLLASVGISQEPPPDAKDSTPALIQRLQSPKYAERDAAHRALLKRADAPPHLMNAMPLLEAEGRKRATAILETLQSRMGKRIFEYARDGRIDLLVEWSGTIGTLANANEFWECVHDLGNEILGRNRPNRRERIWLDGDYPKESYAGFLKAREDGSRFGRAPTNQIVRTGGHLGDQEVRESLIIASGGATLKRASGGTLIFATGDVTIGEARQVLIVADGDVRCGSSSNSIIAAGGTIRLDRLGSQDLRFLCGNGEVKVPGSNRQTDSMTGPWPIATPVPVLFRVLFFSSADLGFDNAIADGAIEVSGVRTESPFGKAGLKAGDVIVSIDGVAMENAASLRRYLRRGFVLGGLQAFVRRGDQRLRLEVSLLGWELPKNIN